MDSVKSCRHCGEGQRHRVNLAVSERRDGRIQPWKEVMYVVHTPDIPQKLSDKTRLMGHRVNAHVG